MHANLFTYSFQARLLVWRRLRQWSVAWLGLILLAGIGALAQIPSIVAARGRLDHALAASEPTRAALGEIDKLEGELADEERRLEKLLPFGPDDRPLAALGGVVDAARASEGRLYVRSIQYANSAPHAAPANGNETSHATLVVEGAALDDEAVDRFVRELMKTGAVTHVELKSCVRENAGGGTAAANPSTTAAPLDERLRFELQCRL